MSRLIWATNDRFPMPAQCPLFPEAEGARAAQSDAIWHSGPFSEGSKELTRIKATQVGLHLYFFSAWRPLHRVRDDILLETFGRAET